MTSKKHTLDIKTSGDFADDPEGAMDALDSTGFALFMINDNWMNDERARKEWRFAVEHDKPMIYIFSDTLNLVKKHNLRFLFEAPKNLIGTINDYGDTKQTGNYIQAMISAYCENNDIKL